MNADNLREYNQNLQADLKSVREELAAARKLLEAYERCWENDCLMWDGGTIDVEKYKAELASAECNWVILNQRNTGHPAAR
jgi:hypothetical protein